ncbi:hypothetical protein ACJX0J_013476 [Zea mays]
MRDARLLEIHQDTTLDRTLKNDGSAKKGTIIVWENMIVIQTKLVSQYTTKHFDLKIVLSVFLIDLINGTPSILLLADLNSWSLNFMLKHIHCYLLTSAYLMLYKVDLMILISRELNLQVIPKRSLAEVLDEN